MIEKDRFRVVAKDSNKQKNYTIIKKGYVQEGKKGYMCLDEDNQFKFYSYPQFHVLSSNGTIEIITKDGMSLEE